MVEKYTSWQLKIETQQATIINKIDNIHQNVCEIKEDLKNIQESTSKNKSEIENIKGKSLGFGAAGGVIIGIILKLIGGG